MMQLSWRRRSKAARPLLMWLICVASVLRAGEPAADAPKPVILLTGFEPFGSIKINPSWETVKTFDGLEIAGYRVATLQLPVVYDEMDAPLKEAIRTHKPSAIICFGVGSRVMQVELLALNGYHPGKPADNKQKPPPRDEIIPGAPASIATALPAAKIVSALKESKIGAGTSNNAGGYLCNECFFRLMASSDAPLRGFVHVPDFGTRDPEGGVFDAEKLKRAVRVIVEATLSK